MKQLLEKLFAEAEEASVKLTLASVAVSAIKARLTIAIRGLEGRPDSRDARLARCLLTEPFDERLYEAIQAEPRDDPAGEATP